MIEKLTYLLEDLAEMIYIIDVSDYKLVYMNGAARKNFLNPGEDYKSKRCFDVVLRITKRCAFCKTEELEHHDNYEWTYYNPTTKQDYLIKETLIKEENRTLKMVKIFTTSIIAASFDNTIKLKNIEQFLLSCVKEIHKNNDFNKAINSMLSLVGEFTRADRVYIFEIYDKLMSNTFEWCNKGVNPEIDTLQNLDISLINWWMSHFNRDECYVMYDLENIKDSDPDVYEVLHRQNINSLMVAPLKIDNKLFGYIGLDNPDVNRINYLLSILDTLSYFVSSIYLKKQTEDYLLKLSYEDSLTKLFNRNRYIFDLNSLNENMVKNVGVLFIDLNDFKETNDRFGHFVGDEMLINVSNILKRIFTDKLVYRYGGDEFIVICNETSKTEFDSLFCEFKDNLSQQNYSASIGYVHSDIMCDLHNLVKIADTNMYEEKQKYYKRQI